MSNQARACARLTITKGPRPAGVPAAAIMRCSTPCSVWPAINSFRPKRPWWCRESAAPAAFPHYMSTYGFHGLHGRAFPVACGIRSRRPDLHMFVVTGDGDCCAIGTAHWIHAIRYNMDLTILLLDNNIYGLTKNQTSPTTRIGERSNTHPKGSYLPPLNPISVTLGITQRFVCRADRRLESARTSTTPFARRTNIRARRSFAFCSAARTSPRMCSPSHSATTARCC